MGNRRASGGLIGKSNKLSGGGNAVTRFNASGTFTAQKGTTVVDVLTIAGGGGGGSSKQVTPFETSTADAGAGGGGAGGYRNSTSQSVMPGALISVTVGAGGAGETADNGGVGTSGANSVFSNPRNPISTTGGGGGGGWHRAPYSTFIANPGGSGGGGGTYGPNGLAGTATGNAGSYDPVEGYAGGISNGNRGGAGGGGAGAIGSGGGGNGGAGGIGAVSSITGTGTYYAGGGSGGARNDMPVSPGGLGGGGHGGGGTQYAVAGPPGYANGVITSLKGEDGHTNTGGGAGGCGSGSGSIPTYGGDGGSGGSGVVIVKELDKAQGVFDMNSQYIAHTKGQWPTRGSGEEIGNSLMFSGGNELTKTPSTSGSRTTFTISMWVKKCESLGERQVLFGAGEDYLRFTDDETIQWIIYDVGATAYSFYVPAKLKDSSAWYHFVAVWNTTSATAADRQRVWMNGNELTANSYTLPDLNDNSRHLNVGSTEHKIGGELSPANDYDFEGYISNVHFIDGQALPAGHFGEPDPDCPQIWRPKKYYGTYGTNGFHLEFKQSGVGSGSASTVGADTSGNLNHWTSVSVAATDQSTDTPTNNFCTLNPLGTGLTTSSASVANESLSEGNTGLTGYDGSSKVESTMGVANGKWYVEYKLNDVQNAQMGITANVRKDNAHLGGAAHDYSYISSNATAGDTGVYNNNSLINIFRDGVQTDGQVHMIAFDLDNNKFWVGQNGTWKNSSDPTDHSGGGGQTIVDASLTDQGFYQVGMRNGSADGATSYINFGNPSFAISSGNADANGYGNFEFAPPSGFYALCSKNLAQYG